MRVKRRLICTFLVIAASTVVSSQQVHAAPPADPVVRNVQGCEPLEGGGFIYCWDEHQTSRWVEAGQGRYSMNTNSMGSYTVIELSTGCVYKTDSRSHFSMKGVYDTQYVAHSSQRLVFNEVEGCDENFEPLHCIWATDYHMVNGAIIFEKSEMVECTTAAA